ncbi:MAG: hypothetical protein ABJG88_13220 [Litorimonas sp.]
MDIKSTDLDRASDDSAIVSPVVEDVPSAVSKGRLADRLAAIIAACALGLALLLSFLFFTGFVVNDYHILAITSALGFSLFLGAFAIVPMGIIVVLALRAYRNGGNINIYLWVLCLILPWLILSLLCLIYTPLPAWMSLTAVLCALSLTFWGIISLGFEVKYKIDLRSARANSK